MNNLLSYRSGSPYSLGNISSTYNLCGSGTRDGHGGNALEHKRMMEEIANEIVDKKL